METGLYFEPVDFARYSHDGKFSRFTLGYQIQKETARPDVLTSGKVKAGLLGVPDQTRTGNKGTARAPGEIRGQLYRLSNIEGLTGLVDLGDLKPGKNERDTQFALRDVIEYLNDSGMVAIVLGGGQDLSIGMARAYHAESNFVMSVIDSRVDIKTSRQVTDASNFVSAVIRENPGLFHLQFIGIQGHLVSPSVLNYLKERTFDCVPLGRLRDDFDMAEPLLRDTTFLGFDISAVKYADAPGHLTPSPNGLSGEEACQLMRYAGLGNRLKAVGLFEVNPDADSKGITSGLAAQMIWYFIEALTQRRNETPELNMSLFTKYFVEIEHLPPLTFYNQPSTRRWWMEIAVEKGENYIVSCRETDYLTAVRQEIPDVWWKYTRKSDQLSKY